jgi:signal transduction histidine kinase
MFSDDMSLQRHITATQPQADDPHRRFAHELANLLDGSLRNLSLATADLESVSLDPHTRLRLTTSAEAMRRMASLLRTWMAGGSSTEPSRLFWQNATLATALGHVLGMLEPEAAEHAVHLHLDLDPSTNDVACDAAWGPIVNVVRNAIELSPPGSSVEIRAWVDHTDACVDVLDAGPGFDPCLERDDDGLPPPGVTTRTGGHGMGLALSRQILTQIGGSLRVANLDAGGVLARLRWPAHASNHKDHP